MIIIWKSNIAGYGKRYSHTYIGYGIQDVVITIPGSLYSEIAHLISMKLTRGLFNTSLINKFTSMKLTRKDHTMKI